MLTMTASMEMETLVRMAKKALAEGDLETVGLALDDLDLLVGKHPDEVVVEIGEEV